MTDPTPPSPNEDPDQAQLEPLATVVFAVFFLGATLAVGYLFWSFFTDFILAALFAVFFAPMYNKLLPRLKNKAWAAASLTCFAVVFVVAVPSTFLIGSLSVEAAHAYDLTRSKVNVATVRELVTPKSTPAMPPTEAQNKQIKAIEEFFNSKDFTAFKSSLNSLLGFDLELKGILEGIANFAGTAVKVLYGQINVVLANIFAAIFHFLMMLLILFYLLIDGARFKRFLFLLSPLPEHEEELLVTKFKDVGQGVLIGNGVGSVLQGFLAAIGMWVVGLPSPVLWGTIMSISAFLPLVGISIICVPATLYLLITAQYVKGIGFLIYFVLISLFVENVVKTKLIGDHMKMHNLLIFLSIIGGLSVFGIIGLLYGPLVVAIFLTLCEMYDSHYKLKLAAFAQRR